jgi:H+/Cl- antiporter ClcA
MRDLLLYCFIAVIFGMASWAVWIALDARDKILNREQTRHPIERD